jgi:hypothetical protein
MSAIIKGDLNPGFEDLEIVTHPAENSMISISTSREYLDRLGGILMDENSLLSADE